MLKRILILTSVLLNPSLFAQVATPPPKAEPKITSSKAAAAPVAAKPAATKSTCPQLARTNVASDKEVYANTPYKPGETSTFKMSFKGMYVGDAVLTVQKPHLHNGSWQQVFDGYGRTGAWYKWIFVAEDQIRAIAHPVDFGVSWFYMEQDEGKLFKSRYIRKKYLDFNSATCIVSEKTIKDKDDITEKKHAFVPGSMDVLSASFKLRTQQFQVGQKITFPMFTSGKNWTAEVDALKLETLKIPDLGEFKTIKLKLKTYIGDKLDQKGDSYLWIAHELPHRPIVQIEAVVKIGSIFGTLKQHVPGKS